MDTAAKIAREIIAETDLAAESFSVIPITETDQVAYVVEVAPQDVERSWATSRKLIARLQRWPIVSTCWCSANSFSDRLQQEDFFSRFYFQETEDGVDPGANELIIRSTTVDVDSFLAGRARKEPGFWKSLEAHLEDELSETRDVHGCSPDPTELGADALTSPVTLDRWLLDWESVNGDASKYSIGKVPWYKPDNACILFLPISSSWDALAYLNWFNTAHDGVENYIALGKRWEKEFGAELVAHYGTMLQCVVARPPTSPQRAWSVAREHTLITESTTSDSLRRYAFGLVGNGRWFLHERP